MKKTVLLVILDGWGIGAKNETNPIHIVNPRNIREIKKRFPIGSLQASGIAIGLPWNEEGNSEVGHLTMGAGKILYQHYPKICLAIRDGSFFQNKILKSAFAHARKNNSGLHLIGLLTAGNVHASFEHLAALIKMAKLENFERLYLHLFTDGRDSLPRSAKTLLEKLEKVISEEKRGVIASLSGRFYALDRDRHWERTERVYQMLIGQGKTLATPEEPLEETYRSNLSDEFVEPNLIGEPRPFQDNDAVIFFDFREDSVRQIVAPFAEADFKNFPVRKFTNLYLVTMTEYKAEFNLPVAFVQEKIEQPLSRVLSEHNKIQMKIAETEKYPHITFFFNGYRNEPFPNEYRILVPSINIPHYDQFPEMMARGITERVISSLEDEGYDFILVNYANPDIIGHTGNYEAALKTVEIIDQEIGRLGKSMIDKDNVVMIITSDHGNIERIFDPFLGLPETQHDSSPVPFYLVNKRFEKIKDEREIEREERAVIGTLADVAPTILEILGVPQPKEMTGQSLLPII